MGRPDLSHNLEAIEAEEHLLLTIQTAQAQEMDAAGITKRAKDLLPNADLNALSRPYVTVSSFEDQEGVTAEEVAIRFATAGIAPRVHTIRYSPEIPVANIYPDSIELNHAAGFSLGQAETLKLMVDGLRDAKNLGVLPHLSFMGKTAHIINPGTAITTQRSYPR